MSRNPRTLGEHYASKQAYYVSDSPAIYDRDLRRIFTDAGRSSRSPTAAAFLRKHARNLDGHSELVLNQIRRLTSEVAPVSDSISLSSASALAPNFSSPSTGGIRR